MRGFSQDKEKKARVSRPRPYLCACRLLGAGALSGCRSAASATVHELSLPTPNWMVGSNAPSGVSNTPNPAAAPARATTSAPGRIAGLVIGPVRSIGPGSEPMEKCFDRVVSV